MDRFTLQSTSELQRSFTMNSRCSRDEDGRPDVEEEEAAPEEPLSEVEPEPEPLCFAGRAIIEKAMTLGQMNEGMKAHLRTCRICWPTRPRVQQFQTGKAA